MAICHALSVGATLDEVRSVEWLDSVQRLRSNDDILACSSVEALGNKTVSISMGLDAVEMVMELETAFEVSMNGVTVTTVGALYDWILARLTPDTATPLRSRYNGELWERYLDVVEGSTRISREQLRPDASFRDLGLN